jgi:hypothetical protein
VSHYSRDRRPRLRRVEGYPAIWSSLPKKTIASHTCRYEPASSTCSVLCCANSLKGALQIFNFIDMSPVMRNKLTVVVNNTMCEVHSDVFPVLKRRQRTILLLSRPPIRTCHVAMRNMLPCKCIHCCCRSVCYDLNNNCTRSPFKQSNFPPSPLTKVYLL